MSDLSGKPFPGDEIEIIGCPVPKETVKKPIEKVKSFQPHVKDGGFETGATYVIGDPERLAFWESLPDDIETE